MPPTRDDILRKLRDQFQFYGDQHSAKAQRMEPIGIITDERDVQLEKARVNYALVAEINDVLLHHETVRVPDTFPKGPMFLPSIPHLIKFVETLAGREDEDYTTISMTIGDLRVLIGPVQARTDVDGDTSA